MNKTIGDMTVDELIEQLRDEIRAIVQEEIHDTSTQNNETSTSRKKRAPLDIPILDVGPWPEHLQLLNREELYGDDGR